MQRPPTTMALRIAEQTGITLVALAWSDSITVYADLGRIRGSAAGLDAG
jgi:formate dehydrogenase assembly factor FdhD